MKDFMGLAGLLSVFGGLVFISVPLAFVAAGGVLILWATIEDVKVDR